MSFSQPIDKVSASTCGVTGQRVRGAAADSQEFNDPTLDCYRRRNRILSNTHRTEWWMALAVVLLMASVGYSVL